MGNFNVYVIFKILWYGWYYYFDILYISDFLFNICITFFLNIIYYIIILIIKISIKCTQKNYPMKKSKLIFIQFEKHKLLSEVVKDYVELRFDATPIFLA